MNELQLFEQREVARLTEGREPIPSFRAGDEIEVTIILKDGATERTQVFKGLCIARAKSEGNLNASFIVRKLSSSYYVEKKFPLYSPIIKSIVVSKRGVVRRAKLYYIRKLSGKKARIKTELYTKRKES